MRYFELFEDATGDLTVARQAQKMVGAFIRWLNDATENATLSDNIWVRRRQVGDRILVTVSANTIGLEGFDDLHFGFQRARDGVGGSLYKTRPHPEYDRQYFAVLTVDFDPLTTDDLAFKLPAKAWNDLEHEVIHYLDYKRGFKDLSAIEKRDQVMAARNRKRNMGNEWDKDIVRIQYFNDPLEFNAYYQAGVSEILTMITRASPRKDRNLFLSDFASFRRSFESCFHADWMRLLDYGNRRRFAKRLYGLFAMLAENWPDIEAIKDRIAEAKADYDRWAEKDAQEAKRAVRA